VVLDDFDRVLDGRVDRELVDLVERHPRLRVVACVRARRYFNRAARSGADVTIVPATELLFTVEDTEHLTRSAGLDLPPPMLTELHRQFAGWVGPLSGALRAFAHKPDPRRLLSAAGHAAAQFWRHQVEPGLDEDTLALLLCLAVPDQLTAPLAQVVTGTDKAAALLRRLERHGLLFSSDDGRIYRFAPQARDVLTRQFRDRYPEQLADLHERLARWYWDAGDPRAAVQHACSSEHWDLVLEIAVSRWRPLFRQHGRLLPEILSQVPVEHFHGRPAAQLLRELVLGLGSDHQPALVPRVDAAREVAVATDGRATADDLNRAWLAMSVYRRRGEFDAACALATRLEFATLRARHLPAMDPSLCAGLLLQIGLTRQVAGDLAGARRPLRVAWDISRTFDDAYIGANAAGNLAMDAALAGDRESATQWLERAASAAPPTGWMAPHVLTSQRLARALLAIDRLDAHSARAELDELSDDRSVLGELWAFTLYARAQWALLWGDRARMARELIARRGEAKFRSPPGSAADVLLTPLLADLLTAAGRTTWAREVLDAATAPDPSLDVARARLALATGRPEHARRVAENGIWRPANPRDRAELSVLQMLALVELGDRAGAVATLRPLLDDGDLEIPLRTWTRADHDVLTALAADLPALRSVLTDLANTATPPLPVVPGDAVELTQRETVVLGYLGRGLTVGQIAKALYVSANTIKTQVRSVYRKLGVTSRREALQSARDLGLLAAKAGTDVPASRTAEPTAGEARVKAGTTRPKP